MSASATSSNRFPEIKKYDLIEEIGHGGMATVYRARDDRLEREVAVKVIHKHLRENQEVRRRFVSEAKAVAKLRHPGIVEVYDVSDEADIERYLVVELIRGSSLRQVLQQHGCFPPEIAAAMAAVLCDAVEHAHQKGVIHRDLKPENVLLSVPEARAPASEPEGESGETASHGSSVRSGRSRVIVKLTDFGIAKVLDAQGVTSTGQILGSPAHMAPEQIEGGTIGPHTDVFALGVLLYECMVGHLPFEGRNPAQVLRRVLEGDFEAADVERPEVGGRWARIIAAALDNSVATRVGSAAELGQMIEDEFVALGIDDPRGDMVDYFLDAQSYEERTLDKIVPALLQRGEMERKIGNTPMAAADFNRALALRPEDLAILKRITSLSAQTVWKERAVRGSAILLGSGALMAAAFGVTRLFRSDTSNAVAATGTAPVVGSAPSSQPSIRIGPDPPAPSNVLQPVSDPAPTPSTSVSATAVVGPRPLRTTQPSASAEVPEPASDTRSVVFRIFPNEASVVINGQTVNSNGRLALAPGTYAVTSTHRCCKRNGGSITVREAKSGSPMEIVSVSLTLKPARLGLTNAPEGGTMVCPAIGATIAGGSSVAVPMVSFSKELSCTFNPSGATATFSLEAGGSTQAPFQH